MAQATEVASGMRTQLGEAGYTDVQIAVRGSAVTGRAYAEVSGRYTGHRFDRGKKPSDIDIAIVSPSLYQRLVDKGIASKTGWIGPLTNRQLEVLKLPPIVPTTINGTNRRGTVMIYVDKKTLQSRGPWMPLGE